VKIKFEVVGLKFGIIDFVKRDAIPDDEDVLEFLTEDGVIFAGDGFEDVCFSGGHSRLETDDLMFVKEIGVEIKIQFWFMDDKVRLKRCNVFLRLFGRERFKGRRSFLVFFFILIEFER
jgi:hypothetical protein